WATRMALFSAAAGGASAGCSRGGEKGSGRGRDSGRVSGGGVAWARGAPGTLRKVLHFLSWDTDMDIMGGAGAGLTGAALAYAGNPGLENAEIAWRGRGGVLWDGTHADRLPWARTRPYESRGLASTT